MLNLLNTWSHGYIIIPVISALQKNQVFDKISYQIIDDDNLTEVVHGNEGYLKASMRILKSLGWIEEVSFMQSKLLQEKIQVVPKRIVETIENDSVSPFAKEKDVALFKKMLGNLNKGWGVNDLFFKTMLDGVLLAPIFFYIFKQREKGENEFDKDWFHSSIKQNLIDLFLEREWLVSEANELRFSNYGSGLVERSMNFGTVISYNPLLLKMNQLIFGNAVEVFTQNDEGHENHVDRSLNIISSGFQHKKYFDEVDNIIIRLFDNNSFSEQPKYIADMGCGDGTFLERIYFLIKNKTERGKALEDYPLTLIGIDYNEKALVETRKTLRNVPHLAIHGDIGAPQNIPNDLKNHISDPENILHIRSFLDHNRPFIPAKNSYRVDSDSFSIGQKGELIGKEEVFGSLVEHFERWAQLETKFGMLILEVHSLPANIVNQYLTECENLHFDAYHAFSHQHLVEASTFLLAAAAAGLYVDRSLFKKFPGQLPYSRITLNYLKKQNFIIRTPIRSDLQSLYELEIKGWPRNLRKSQKTIKQRVIDNPLNHLVVVVDNKIVGVVYTQFINDASVLNEIKFEEIDELSTSKSKIVQLLNLTVDPAYQHMTIGDHLRAFLLDQLRLKNEVHQVVGISRCRDFFKQSTLSFDEYVFAENDKNEPIDPILKFHRLHGATIEKVLKGYRKKDKENNGNGILIQYDLRTESQKHQNQTKEENKSYSRQEIAIKIKQLIKKLLRSEKQYNSTYPLMEMGLDSVDLMELGVLIHNDYGTLITPSYFFQFNTPEAVIEELVRELGSRIKEQKPIVDELPNDSLTPDFSEDDIAIIGYRFRFPGANTKEKLWRILSKGLTVIDDIPDGRIHWPDWVDNTYKGLKRGGCIDNISNFDSAFFRITPREAELMDPQQRILLELTWELIEAAGYKPSDLKGSETGVYIGASGSDYELCLREEKGDDALTGTGTSMAILANRLSYFFDLEGPSLQLDTACSSSLVAVHEAIKSIKSGESKQAIVGGINIICHSARSLAYYKANMLSVDAKCSTFDKDANGFVRAEGAAVLMLKPLHEAMADNDSIAGVIKSTAINHGGQASGLTVPNPDKQRKLLEKAYEKANIDVEKISYIEAHGTGTSLGDPIEIAGLTQAFKNRKRKSTTNFPNKTCGLGSVKTNLGHLEAASGMAGIIKVLLSMEKEALPPTVNFNILNPKIDPIETPFYINHDLKDWKGKQLIAGVSSFGIGGTNAHVVLQNFTKKKKESILNETALVFVLSAKNEECLKQYATRVYHYLENEVDLRDLVYSLQVAKEEFAKRIAIVFKSKSELKGALLNYISNKTSSLIFEGNVLDDPNFISTISTNIKNLNEVAHYWVNGHKIKWNSIYDRIQPSKIELPAYPFLKQNHWFPTSKMNEGNESWKPLLVEDHLDKSVALFSATLKGNEPFLRDHIIEGEKVFPAVVTIELAKLSGEIIAGKTITGLKNLNWFEPIIIRKEQEIFVKVFTEKEALRFEICGQDTNIINCSGTLEMDERKSEKDRNISGLIAQFSNQTYKRDCYQLLAEHQFNYGSTFQVIDEIHYGINEAISLVLFAKNSDKTLRSIAIADAALQTCLLQGLLSNTRKNVALPYSVSELVFYNEIPDKVWCYVRKNTMSDVLRYELELFDQKGKCLARFDDIVFLQNKPSSSLKKNQNVYFTEVWKRAAIDADIKHRFGKKIAFNGHSNLQLAKKLERRLIANGCEIVKGASFDEYTTVPNEVYFFQGLDLQNQTPDLNLFLEIKKVIATGNKENEQVLTVFTRNTQRVYSNENVSYHGSGIIGLLGSLAKEVPHWKMRIIDLDIQEEELDQILAVPYNNQITALRNKESYQRFLCSLSLEKQESSVFKSQKVYVILGGAGGIGEATTNYLVSKYQAQVVWLGRKLENEKIIRQLNRIEKNGPRPVYIQCDACQKHQVIEAYQQIKTRFSNINGIFHSAIVLNDRLIENMSENDFTTVFTTKSLSSKNVIDVFKDEPLDFICFYNSIQSYWNALGQGNYAAGCTFGDSFSKTLQQTMNTPVYSINWGYWGEIGIVADEAVALSMRANGVASISEAEGMQLLETILSNDIKNVVALKLIKDTSPLIEPYWVENNVAIMTEKSHVSLVLPKQEKFELKKEIQTDLDKICAKAILQILSRIGLHYIRRSVANPSCFEHNGIDLFAYHKLLTEIVRKMFVYGYLQEIENKLVLNNFIEVELQEWNLKKELSDFTHANPNYKAHVRLLKECFENYEAILQGKVRATDVIFPNGKFDLVNGIYKNNYQSDYFNQLVAEFIPGAILEYASQQKTIKILEIGAGTGGTSEAIFKKIDPTQKNITYYFTDVSNSFLIEAQNNYKTIAPYLEIKRLDIEKDVQSQGFNLGVFDIILGTNVVHATKSIVNTISNLKKLLKKDGILLLNELNETNLFFTLTFGLLEGWWLYEDNAERLQSSPLLSKESWEKILNETGFENTLFTIQPDAGQQLILAKSNGIAFTQKETVKIATNDLIKCDNPDNSNLNAETFLKDIFSKVLKMKTNSIDELAAFDQLGIDSILIGALAKELTIHLDEITTTLFFEFRNVKDLAAHLLVTYPAFFNKSKTINQKGHLNTQRSTLREEVKGIIQTNDIAIIGVAGKYPEANNLNQFWENLKHGKNSITEIPKERWDNEMYYTDQKGKPGTINGKYGGFIDGMDEFDPLFFNISPKEAQQMDPQERLFLQTVYETIGEAGYTPEELSKDGRKKLDTGVYVGVMYQEYQFLGVEESQIGMPTAIGKTPSSIANRVSYHYNFSGPCMAIDTMCSSSLTAIHLACNDLLTGTCDLAVAGGVNVSIHPNKYLMLSQGGFLSGSGKCESFADGGDGFVPSEGVGAILLKPLNQAIEDGDHIHGVIKGTAINHGGKVNGFTVPNPNAQAQVIQRAIKKAGVRPEEISYVETHGTGTTLGDPIEIRGLVKAYESSEFQFCKIGSVKSNIGHCESAAGIAGLTKLLLQFKYKALVPSIHSEELNRNIDFANSPFQVQQHFESWSNITDKPLLAGISGFGAGGSNAHIIVEEFNTSKVENQETNEEVLIVLSAKNDKRIIDLVVELKNHLELHINMNLKGLALTLQMGRVEMNNRLAFTAHSIIDVIDKLNQFINEEIANLSVGDVKKRIFNFVQHPVIEPYPTTVIGNLQYKKLGELWVQGIPVFSKDIKFNRVSLPTYVFAKNKYWFSKAENTIKDIAEKTENRAIVSLEYEVTFKMLEWISEILKIELIDLEADEEIGDYGFDSVTLIQFSTTINQFYQLEIVPTIFYSYPTVELLTGYLCEEFEAELQIKHNQLSNESAEKITESKNHEIRSQKNPLEKHEPIAIVGMSARFPGATNIDEFWDNLVQNKDLITKIPSSRWKIREEDIEWGGFIEGIDEFDPLFFNISPAEAELMDPQQRITLETVFKALEDAGIPSTKVKGTNTGVFIGCSSADYSTLLNKSNNGEEHQAHFATGIANSVLANRISYLFDFHGPSEPVDTACSSSLIAIHKAVLSIRNGDCEMAIAGGVNALLSPELSRSFNRSGMLSKDGRCKTFDQHANGYVRGEGVGIIVLKSLQKAVENGDRIYAVINGSAENHGGKANTMTSPNPNAQKELLLKAFDAAKVQPNRISYIESHGTGTALGDPIETEGLKLAFEGFTKTTNSSVPHKCALGSVKANIGHLEAAAGVAGLIKLVLAIKNKTIPGNPHLKEPNRYLKLEDTPFYLQKDTAYWEIFDTQPRIAGISSFGAGGSNAHVIVSEFHEESKPIDSHINEVLVVLSAQNMERLKQRAIDLDKHLKDNPEEKLVNIAYTLQVGRNEMSSRVAITVRSILELRTKLERFITAENENLSKLEIFSTRENIKSPNAPKFEKIDSNKIVQQIELRQLATIAAYWVNLQKIDWSLFYVKDTPSKISLPTYPFAKEKYWFSEREEKNDLKKQLHPLLHFEMKE